MDHGDLPFDFNCYSTEFEQRKCLEDLPDEIFLKEIYPYFSLEELDRTFLGLNQRLSNIARSTDHLNFVVDSKSVTHPALTFLKSSVASLTVCLGQFDIIDFHNIRTLILQYPSLQQRKTIRPENFPLLTSLRLSYLLEDRELLNVIFSGSFPCLTRCQFDRVLADHTWDGAPTLRYLRASVSGEYGTTSVLRSCPNLSRLSIIIYDELQKDLVLPCYSISCKPIVSLRKLFIRSTFEIFLEIVKLMPNLRRLTFDDITKFMGYHSSIFTFQLLSHTLRNLPQLSYLHFAIQTSQSIAPDFLQALHPLFRNCSYDRVCAVITSSTDSADPADLN